MSGVAWVAIWGFLIVATIVGAGLLGLSLYRKLRGVLKEASGVAELAQLLATALEETHDEPEIFLPALTATDAQQLHWRQRRSHNLRRRRERRNMRRQRTMQRWQEIGIPF